MHHGRSEVRSDQPDLTWPRKKIMVPRWWWDCHEQFPPPPLYHRLTISAPLGHIYSPLTSYQPLTSTFFFHLIFYKFEREKPFSAANSSSTIPTFKLHFSALTFIFFSRSLQVIFSSHFQIYSSVFACLIWWNFDLSSPLPLQLSHKLYKLPLHLLHIFEVVLWNSILPSLSCLACWF